MLAGFLAAMRKLSSEATFSSSVPFPLAPLRRRFAQVDWHPHESEARERAIAACDVWLGLGGSPFQHALSRWFIDHLLEEAAICARLRKPMFFVGVGVQSTAELESPDVRALCAQAAGIWTRDEASATRLASVAATTPIEAAADLAHIFFRGQTPPRAIDGRVTLVPNFDYADWTDRDSVLAAVDQLGARECIWLAQESRELPGAERALFHALPAALRSRWQLVVPDVPDAPLTDALARWPSGEWLITARYHAALAGAWAGSKVVVIATNEKLRAAARELDCPVIPPDADPTTVLQALCSARSCPPPSLQADRAFAACGAFVAAAQKLAPR